MEISKTFSNLVYDDGVSAVEDRSQPYMPMAYWQFKNRFTLFQLPEPFTGRKSDLGLAFICFNVSIRQRESIPKETVNWCFEKHNNLYRNRFDNPPRNAFASISMYGAV